MSNKGKAMAMLPMIFGIAGGALTLIISIIVVNKVIDSTSLISISRFLVFINTESNRYFYLLLAVSAGLSSVVGGLCSWGNISGASNDLAGGFVINCILLFGALFGGVENIDGGIKALAAFGLIANASILAAAIINYKYKNKFWTRIPSDGEKTLLKTIYIIGIILDLVIFIAVIIVMIRGVGMDNNFRDNLGI